MAEQVLVRGATGRHAFSLTHADLTVGQAFPDSGFLATLGRSYGTTLTVPRRDLLESARSLLEEVRRQWDVLPYRYSYEIRRGGRDDCRTRGSAGASGFKIGGRDHTIRGGDGVCRLDEWEDGPDGKGRVAKSTDVRGRKAVETDDWGPIKLSRKKIDVTLPERLEELVAFLGEISDTDVRLRISDGSVTVADLVRLADDGNDEAVEQLYEAGDESKRELLAMAADRKARKLHPTVARILLTAFPSADAREAVERLAERERDPELRKGYLLLLALTGQTPNGPASP